MWIEKVEFSGMEFFCLKSLGMVFTIPKDLLSN
jgi:hypothetical protein